MKLSLAITTMNRYEMTVESFAQVIDDPRIDDIVLLDDASTNGDYERLHDHFKDNEKVRVIRQAQNRGMSLNKRDAIALSKNEWVIIFDSDNVISTQYLDAINTHLALRDFGTIYCPSFARPQFDYRIFEGLSFAKENTSGALKDPSGNKINMLLNTCNYTVNRVEYLQVYEHNPEMKGTDTVWFNYLWLKAGYSFYVVPGMQYFHRVHEGSGFLQDADYNMKKSAEVRKLIMEL